MLLAPNMVNFNFLILIYKDLITTYIKQNLCDNITDLGLCTGYYLTEAELEKMFFEQC